ncbi:MAG: hypothetical protein ABI591_13630 [Kofleriaceae bacterium]
MTAEAWLRRLCDATGLPPQTDDITALLAAWAVVVSARQEILDAERPNLAGAIVVEVVREIVAELELRQDSWRVALAIAHQKIGRHRVGVAKVRRYQRSTNAADF